MKSSAKEIMEEVVNLLFPLLKLKRANAIVNTKIQDVEDNNGPFSYMSGYENLTPELAQKYLDKTFEARKSLEDKAKANVFGVTIAVSLIVGFSQLFINNNFIGANIFLKIVTYLLVFYSLSSVTIGTILSLLVLGKYNRVYDVFPIDANNNDGAEKLRNIAVNAELNSLYNVKRNNILYSSYGLIINFLAAISISFLVVIVSSKPSTKEVAEKEATSAQRVEGRLQVAFSHISSIRTENRSLSEKISKVEKATKTSRVIIRTEKVYSPPVSLTCVEGKDEVIKLNMINPK